MAEIESVEIKLNVPWGHIAAKSYGPSTGKPVLLVHGRLDNAGSFTRLIKYLPTDYYYVCVDLPGHGWSSHFPSWQRVDFLDYVNVIHFILEELRWRTCIYIGHSMGAQLGIIFSITQPHRIKKMIILDGIVPIYQSEDMFIQGFKDTFALALKTTNSNMKSALYTNEEILYALENLRGPPLTLEAANALFERAVTKINGAYKYNRDVRLKSLGLLSMCVDQLICVLREIKVPLYLIIASQGICTAFKDLDKVIKSVDPKVLIDIIYVDGTHDVHNNNPEMVGSFVRKMLLNNNEVSKI